MARPVQRGGWWLGAALLPAAGAAAALVFSWPASVTALIVCVAAIAGAVVVWKTVVSPVDSLALELREVAARLWSRAGIGGDTAPSQGNIRSSVESLERLGTALSGRARDDAVRLQNLRAVIEAAASPVLATDGAGTVLVCNRAAEEFFGRSAVVGRSIEDLFTQPEVLRLHAAAVNGEAREAQVRFQLPDGMRVHQVLAAPVALLGARAGEADKPQTGAVVTLRDITDMALAVQLKTDFVANASHELRTPLSSIRAAVDTLADGAWDDEAMRSRLTSMIAENVRRLEAMIGDLLDLSRLESSDEAPLQPQEVHLADLGAALGQDFEGVIRERNLTIDFDIEPAVETLQTDPRLLSLILKNLVDNATKFAHEGTQVRVVGRRLAGADGRAGLRMQVIDRGIGIPISQQTRIFERFFQVDPARSGMTHRRGTGLGLAIVKHAVKALGGAISVESVWKQGTTMTVELPGCVAPAPQRMGA